MEFNDEELIIIQKEFTRLKGKTYLDHAGASLYPERLVKNITDDLCDNLLSNPHTSKHTADCIDQIRYLILENLNADPDEYSVVFTAGATASLKLVAESFNYGTRKKGAFVYLEENHTSVLGMRELASSKGADVMNVSRRELGKLMDSRAVTNGDEAFRDAVDGTERALFVYPAQCNFDGYKYPLGWIEAVDRGALNGFTEGKNKKTYPEWFTFLDAAALLSTNNLDLSLYKPDFCGLSFYKMFGYPTGLGALIVKNDTAHVLDEKPYYGGGTVEIAMSQINYHVKREALHERFEDGSSSFLSILSLKHGYETMTNILGLKSYRRFMDKVSRHTFGLARLLYNRLKSLHHRNGFPAVKLYTDSNYDDVDTQGGIVNFNLLRENGLFVGFAEVVHMAELFDIIVRSGCFCNPGACQRHLNLTDDELRHHHEAGHKCGDNNDLIDGVPTGSVRVSFGYMSTERDVNALIHMIKSCFLQELTGRVSDNNSIMPDGLDNDLEKKGVLKNIYVYPIKSCAPFECRTWRLGPKGLLYDREWMIVTENGVPLTQKQEPRMCLIKPHIDVAAKIMSLKCEGFIDLPISIESGCDPDHSNFCRSKVCNDRVQAYFYSRTASEWLSDVLMIQNLRLVRQCENDTRHTKMAASADSHSIALSNQAQYLLINSTSIEWLSGKVPSGEFRDRTDNLTHRFRGNLIVGAEREFEELSWERIRIGSNTFRVDSPCTRCQMVCIDQETGHKTTEPLRTISKEFQGKLRFGVYLTHISSENDNVLTCGDTVSVKFKSEDILKL